MYLRFGDFGFKIQNSGFLVAPPTERYTLSTPRHGAATAY